MNTIKKWLIALAVIVIAMSVVYSCDKEREKEKPIVTDSITIYPGSLSLFENGFSVKESGASQSVSFTASGKWSVTVSTASAQTKAVDWIKINPLSGNAGSISITIAISANKTAKSRYAVVTITCGNVSKSFRIEQEGNAINVESISLNKKTLELKKGEAETLKAEITPSNATEKTISWTSSNTSVVSVDENGKVTALGGGNAIITAACGNKKAECDVKVKVDATSITLDREDLNLLVGENYTLKATISPSDATDKSVIWSSSNSAVATVDGEGYVIGIKEGMAVISAATVFGNSATCKVVVKKPMVDVSSVIFNTQELSLSVGNSEYIRAMVLPDDATNKTLTWKSSNADIVSVDQNGMVKAIAPGSVTITATSHNGKQATCNVKVSDPIVAVTSILLNKTTLNMFIGDTEQLVATILPENATDKSVTWKSNNASVVTVEQNGNVKAVAQGTAQITLTAKNGVQALCTVNVSKPVIEVTSISLNKTEVYMVVGNTEQIIVTVLPENATDKSVTWKSNNTSVVTVDQNGIVNAVAAGSAIITATSKNGKQATCGVKISNPIIDVTSIWLNNTSLDMYIGDTKKLYASLQPANATDKSLTWTSNNASVASVDQNGNVRAIAAGSTTITATAHNGKQAACEVKVIISVTSISFNKSKITLLKGSFENLVVTILPENATDKSFTLESIDPSIATIDQNGKVRAISPGTTHIVAVSNGFRRSYPPPGPMSIVGGGFDEGCAVCTITVVDYSGDLNDRPEDVF